MCLLCYKPSYFSCKYLNTYWCDQILQNLATASVSTVAQSYLTLCDPMDCSTAGFPVIHQLPELAQTHVFWVGGTIQPSHPFSSLLLPSIFPCIRFISNEYVFHIKWPKYWSFSFNMNPSNEHSGLISFRIGWIDLPTIQETLKSLLQTKVQKHQFLSNQLSL